MKKKTELTQEQKDTLERFKKQFPGLWELIVELFGEFEAQEPNGV